MIKVKQKTYTAGVVCEAEKMFPCRHLKKERKSHRTFPSPFCNWKVFHFTLLLKW